MKAWQLLNLPWPLTPRQIEVLQRYTQCGMLKTVANDMGLSFKTVDSHMVEARRKVKVSNNTLLVLEFDRATRKK